MTTNLIRCFKLAGWLVFILIVLLVIVVPMLSTLLIKSGQMPLDWLRFLSFFESAQLFLMQGLGIAWLFFLGSCFASFLNVVAWRVPRGRGINGSSMCPFCETKLKFSDNLPIVGWIRNHGACRTCKQPISPRYLVVEIILGAVFLLICSIEILAGGANLPLRELDGSAGLEHLLFNPKWELIHSTIYHLTLICLLFTFSLIRSERLRVAVSIFITGSIFGIGIPLLWPDVMLVSWEIGNLFPVEFERFSFDPQYLTMLFGIVGGLACGLLLSWATFNPETQRLDQSAQSTIEQKYWLDDAIASLVLVGLFLGWQSAISVTWITLLIQMLSVITTQRRSLTFMNLSTQIFLATVIHLIAWRATTWLWFWPSPTATELAMVLSVVVLVMLGVLTRATVANKPFTLNLESARAVPTLAGEFSLEESKIVETPIERSAANSTPSNVSPVEEIPIEDMPIDESPIDDLPS